MYGTRTNGHSFEEVASVAFYWDVSKAEQPEWLPITQALRGWQLNPDAGGSVLRPAALCGVGNSRVFVSDIWCPVRIHTEYYSV